MTTDLNATLTALLARWDTLADEAARKLEASRQPAQGDCHVRGHRPTLANSLKVLRSLTAVGRCW